MKLVYRLCLVAILGTPFSVRADLTEEIPVVGIDQNKVPFSSAFSAADFQNRMAKMLGQSDHSILSTLERQSCALGKRPNWLLRTVAVGLGIGVEGGLGPIINASAKARLRLVYTNSRNPVFPD